MTGSAWNDARRLLCVRLDSIGDVLMTSPAFRALKQSAPGRHLTLLTSPAGALIARRIPEIDEILVYEAPWMKATAVRESASPDRALIQTLRDRRFDGAVLFTVYSQSALPAALVCFLAGIPRRLAYCRENPYQLLTHWVKDPEPEQFVRHEVRRHLDLVADINARCADERLSLSLDPAAQARLCRKLRAQGVDRRRPIVVVHPGATAPSRRYPPEKFALAARLLWLQSSAQIVFSGNAEEVALVEGIRRGMAAPSVSLAGALDLDEMAALLSLAAVLVVNNTGPAHMAAALGTPVVDLYALTNPQHTPWQVPSRVLYQDVPCRYCYKSLCPMGHHDCLRKVAPESVASAALELMLTPGQPKTEAAAEFHPRVAAP